MNIFYVPASQVHEETLELTGQEFRHAAKVLRYREGDRLVVVDGAGGRYDCVVAQITDESLRAKVKSREQQEPETPEKVLALALLKKRDRLEFAVEKAVELGVSEIALFRGRHTVKENVRMDRLESTVIAAMKQSLRAWLPKVHLFDSLKETLEHYPKHTYLLAHKDEESSQELNSFFGKKKILMLVGPEGGFSDPEIEMIGRKGGTTISLGSHRLRSETAAIAFLSRFL